MYFTAMDTTAITTVRHGLLHIIQDDLDTTHWLLLFLGCVMYWLNKLNATRKLAAGAPYYKAFWADNLIEIPTSVLSCLVLAILAKGVSTDLIDLHGTIAVFMSGYFSSSVLNGLISAAKPNVKAAANG